MIPTDTHLDLLRALPDEVMEKLRAHTPGHMAWITQIDGGGDAIRWILSEKSAGNWLPCDPTAILRVASDLFGGRNGQGMLLVEEGGFELSVSADHSTPDATGRERESDHFEVHSDDAHEAALRLLLAVCGGEE